MKTGRDKPASRMTSRVHRGLMGLFAAAVIHLAPSAHAAFTTIATDAVSDHNAYTRTGDWPSVATATSGGVDNGAYVRTSVNNTAAKTSDAYLTAGFGASVTVQAGTYRLSAYSGDYITNRGPWETFDPKLMTTNGVEWSGGGITKTVVTPYEIPQTSSSTPDWSTVVVEYEIPTGHALIGQQFTWGFNATKTTTAEQFAGAFDSATVQFESALPFVTYDGNGNTGGSAPVDENSPYNPDDTVTVLGAGDLVKTGYSFTNWNTVALGGGTAYLPGNTFSITETTTLYAQWTANSYTVTLNPQGGSDGSVSVSATYDSAMPAATAPTRASYVFDGYFTAADGGGTQYYDADMNSVANWDVASNTELYAKWLSTYTITYNANGADDGTVPDPQVKVEGVDLTLALNTGNLVKDGYAFGGWNTQADGLGDDYAAGGTYNVDADDTLYVKWTVPPFTWEGDEDGAWNTAGNWYVGTGVPTGSDNAYFIDAGVPNTTITVGNNQNIGTIFFSGSVSHIFNSNWFYPANPTAISSTSSGNITFNAGIRANVAQDYTFVNNGTGLLTFTGSGTGFWKEGGDGNFFFDGTGDIAIHSLTKRYGTYTTSLIKNGTGTLTINNYQTAFYAAPDTSTGGLTDDTTVNEGTIRITSGDERSLGRAMTASATYLTLNGGALQVSTLDLNIGADATYGANAGVYLDASGGTLNVDTNLTLTIGDGGGANIISGSGALTKTGAGTLTLTGANAYDGLTTVSAGTLTLGAAGTLPEGNNVALAGGALDIGTGANVAGTLSTSGSSTIALGTGTLSFTGAGTWDGTLTLTGALGENSLRFGTNASGLSSAQLSSITYDGGTVALDSNGYVVVRTSGTLYLFR